MEKYLFLFSISPVQSFIAQARKAQDLYAGSLILSDLMKKVVGMIKTTESNEIIFPSLKNDDSSATHRILAIIETSDMQHFGDELEVYAQEKLIEFARPIIDLLSSSEEQLRDQFKFYWAAKKYTDEKHQQQYKELEKLLGGVKNSRTFNLFSETGGRKCALNEEYNVKFYRKNENEKSKTKQALISTKIFHPDFKLFPDECNTFTPKQIQEGEGLCAISLLKRLYKINEIENFPSTAKVALSDSLEKLKKSDASLAEFALYQNELQGKNYDDQLFYEENLTSTYFKKNKIELDLSVIKRKHKALKIKAANVPFTKYYAIIQFDGDNMGRWLSGDFLNADKDFHTTLSKCLSDFSEEAKKTLTMPVGCTIYAGGDDFVGLVNIHHLFDVLHNLRELFTTIVDTPIQNEFKHKFIQLNKHLSFSAGISIAHYKEPLSIALACAHEMQTAAKKNDFKDSVGISVLKGSGDRESTVLSFGDHSKNINNIFEIFKILDSKLFSTSFISNLDREFRLFMDDSGEVTLSRELIYAELERLIMRSFISTPEIADDHVTKVRKKEKSKEMAELIFSLYEGVKFKNLISLLNILDFMIRKSN